MSDEEIIAVVSAHKEGKKIEVRPNGAITWTLFEYPSWNFAGCDYRVAPEDAHLITGYCFPKDISMAAIVGMIKVRQIHLDHEENPIHPEPPRLREWRVCLDSNGNIYQVKHQDPHHCVIVREVLE